MRKIVLMAGLLGVVLSVGCKHVGGKCDCYHDASQAEIPAGIGAQPYPQVGTYHGPGVPEKLGAPVEKAK